MFINDLNTEDDIRSYSPLQHDWHGRFSRKGKKQEDKAVNKRLIDSILIIIFIALLLCTNFMLFAGSGNIEVFQSSIFPIPEVLLIMGGFFVFAAVIIFSLYKHDLIKNIVAALFMLIFIYALYQQFYQIKEWINVGSWAIPIYTVIGVLFSFAVFVIFSQEKIIYKVLAVIALSILFMQIYLSYMESGEPHEFIETHNTQTDIQTDSERFIYIMLPNLVSYPYLSSINSQASDETQKVMMGFLQKNKFQIFPYAYTTYDNYLNNMVVNLNPASDKSVDEHLLNTRLLSEYWRFHNLKKEYIYLKNNELYNLFKKKHFQISAYKSRDFDMCHVNHKYNVNRCIEKVNQPTNIYSLSLTTIEKARILVFEWLSSMNLFHDMTSVYRILTQFTNVDQVPMVGINYNNLYVVNSVKTFDLLLDNIKNDQGKQAYFVFADIPSDMYIYDEYCQLKPQEKWLDMTNLPWITSDYTEKRRNAYLQQTKCLIGKLENFIDNLKQNKKLSDTTIILQGISGVNDFKNYQDDDYYQNFMGNRMVTMAIYDPTMRESSIDSAFCPIQKILSSYLFGKDNCRNIKYDVHEKTIRLIKQELVNLTKNIKTNYIKDFSNWYRKWLQFNQSKNVEIDIIQNDKNEDEDFGLSDLFIKRRYSNDN